MSIERLLAAKCLEQALLLGLFARRTRRRPRCTIQCIYCIIHCIHSVSATSPDTEQIQSQIQYKYTGTNVQTLWGYVGKLPAVVAIS